MPGDRWLLFGRSLHIPNPLTPHCALVRTRWNPLPGSAGTGTAANCYAMRLTAVRWLTVAVFIVLVCLLPATLAYAGAVGFLFASLLAYLLIVVMLALIHRHRCELALTSRQVLVLAFEAIACAPFAINTFRKVTLQTIVPPNALTFAARALSSEQFNAFLTALIQQVDIDVQYYDDGDPRSATLAAYRQRLEAMRPTAPAA